MLEYLEVSKAEQEPELDSEGILDFVRVNANPDVTEDDIEQYLEILDILMEKSNCSTELMEVENKLSLTAIVAYSFMHDIDLDDWILHYCSENNDYFSDQMENIMLNTEQDYFDFKIVELPDRSQLIDVLTSEMQLEYMEVYNSLVAMKRMARDALPITWLKINFHID